MSTSGDRYLKDTLTGFQVRTGEFHRYCLTHRVPRPRAYLVHMFNFVHPSPLVQTQCGSACSKLNCGSSSGKLGRAQELLTEVSDPDPDIDKVCALERISVKLEEGEEDLGQGA